MLRFTLLGFPVSVHWMFWVTTLLLSGDPMGGPTLQLFVWVAACFVSILFHELGHAIFVRRFGGQPQILLIGFGGLTTLSGPLPRWRDIQVSLAGPAFSLILGGVMWELAHISTNDGPAVVQFLRVMIWINLAWTLVNLLPVLPLDGGRVTAALFGPRHIRGALVLGIVVALVAAAVFVMLQQFYAGVFFGFMAFNNFQSLQTNRRPQFPGMG